MTQYILAIDQGTTSSRAIIFTREGEPVSQHQIELTQYYPEPGWVEQDPEEIWDTTLTCCREAIRKLNITANDISTIGISNQRETTIIWDKKTGKPISRAIVWQDRRTADMCRELSEFPIASELQTKTGLLLDPYFSATKILWLLNTIPNARLQAEMGELAFGTVDTFLLWRLTQGESHATDATNASRTLLLNINTQDWDNDILGAFKIPREILPQVLDSSAHFGKTHENLFGAPISITGIAGDQQAATVGQACFHPGMVKSTYGTGCFMLMNTGSKLIHSKNKLLGTIAYRLNGKVVYGLEGSIFSAGVAIKWLRDALKIIKNAEETETLAMHVPDTGGVYFVPGFTGLGAPYWDPDARGAILGLTRDSNFAHISRAALEAVCYQTLDLLNAMQNDSGTQFEILRVDGGMVANNWLLQFLTDILNVEVERPACFETSALGAAYLAGLHVGLYKSLEEISQMWRANARFIPKMQNFERDYLYGGWKNAVERVLTRR